MTIDIITKEYTKNILLAPIDIRATMYYHGRLGQDLTVAIPLHELLNTPLEATILIDGRQATYEELTEIVTSNYIQYHTLGAKHAKSNHMGKDTRRTYTVPKRNLQLV